LVRIPWLLRAPRSASMVAVTLALVVGALGWLDLPEAKEELNYANGLHGAHKRLGRMLSGSSFRDKRLALSDGGAIPYLSDLWTLDLTGLNDAQIATTGRREPGWVSRSTWICSYSCLDQQGNSSPQTGIAGSGRSSRRRDGAASDAHRNGGSLM